MSDPRYPIGKFERPAAVTPEQREAFIEAIAATPLRMREALDGLSAGELDTAYREGGWTARQVAHHVPDSHMNAYIRCKLALTEEQPTIRTYEEDRWARLADTRDTPIEISLSLLDALHTRWVTLLRALPPEDFARTLNHPDHGPMTLDQLLAMYAWHGRHHVAHVASVRRGGA
jgi:uncharacterized damage-inducible protein DinB